MVNNVRDRAATPAEFRSLMSMFPTGVAVVTAMDAGSQPWGMTCSSVCSVSVDPPTLLVSLRQGSPTLAAMVRQNAFAVNLLHHRARSTAELFASGDAERFGRIRWHGEPTFGGPHLPADAHAVADCRITQTVPIADHVVVFGAVYRVEVSPPEQGSPLLYGFRQYSSWATD